MRRVDASAPKKLRAHVVLEADHGVAALGEVDDGLGADQAAGAGDDGDGHGAVHDSLAGVQRAVCGRRISAEQPQLLVVRGDPAEESAHGPAAARPPVRVREQPRAVGDVDRNVAGRVPRRLGPTGTALPGELAAQLGRLEQREAALAAAADVDRRAGPVLGTSQLLLDQLDQVVDVQQVAHLLAGAAEADVAQRPPEVVGEHPVA